MNIKQLVKWSTLMISVLLTVAVGLTGCGGGGGNVTTITMAGSTTVQPLAQALADDFTSNRTDVEITVAGGGSSVGVSSAAAGTVDIGMASRELKQSEKTLGLVEHVIGRDAIVIVCSASFAGNVTGLTTNQTRDIFSGNITNWAEVGGGNVAIQVYAREEGSGTRAAFEEIVMKGANITGDALLFPSNGALRTAVAGDPTGVGFLSMGYLDSSISAFDIDGVEATLANAKNGTYPVIRPLLFLTLGAPTGKVAEFINFCLGPVGQAIVAIDWIPVI